MIIIHPSAARTWGKISSAIHKNGNFALLLGAGVDIEILKEVGSKAPTWTELIMQLKPFPGRKNHSEFKHIIDTWPQETASLARARLGDMYFKEKIGNELNLKPNEEPNIGGKVTKALAELISYTNLIITTNYSLNIEKVIRKFQPTTQVQIYTREDLASFQIPDPVTKPDIIYIVYLHGKCSELSDPILDTWGYSIAQDDDHYYSTFLKEVFTKRHVLSIGTSWTDTPLKNSSAYVYRTKPYLRQNHLAIIYNKNKKDFESSCKPIGTSRAWAYSMKGCYGVTPVFAHNNLDEHINSLLYNNPDPIKISELDYSPDYCSNLQNIAEYLDKNGDFESTRQFHWICDNNPFMSINQIDENLQKIANYIMASVNRDASLWYTAARIERHLRHHIWMYVSPVKRDTLRGNLWESVVRAALAHNNHGFELDPRTLFDLKVGEQELNVTSQFSFKGFSPAP